MNIFVIRKIPRLDEINELRRKLEVELTEAENLRQVKFFNFL